MNCIKDPRITFRRNALAAAVVLGLAGAAQAQLSTSTIKGLITSGAAAAQPGLVVTAVNQANGTTYRTATLADGSYVLAGLAPGAYEIRVAGPSGSEGSVTTSCVLEWPSARSFCCSARADTETDWPVIPEVNVTV